jgi:hypothetical protein
MKPQHMHPILDLNSFMLEMKPRIHILLDEVLDASGCSQAGRSYILQRDGIWKWASYCTWAAKPTSPTPFVAEAIALHMAGIKMIDDLVDQDSPASMIDLAVGARLLALAGFRLGSLAHEKAEQISRSGMDMVWHAFISEARYRPTNFDEWHVCASSKAGLLLQTYYRHACAAQNTSTTWSDFMRALGMLLMIRDDVRDYVRKSEKNGNLVSMIPVRDILLMSSQQHEIAFNLIKLNTLSGHECQSHLLLIEDISNSIRDHCSLVSLDA